jgi:hypothetical protein
MSALSFSASTTNKIGDGIEVSGRNTLIKTEAESKWRVAIADEPIDAKVDGKKMFCVRVEKLGAISCMMIGFTPMEVFDSNKNAFFGNNGFTGCGMYTYNGNLKYPNNKGHDIIDREISQKSKEIIVILTISNNGTKKEIRFLCDGKESESTDVSEYLEGDFLYPAICLCEKNQQVTTIPIDQVQIRTPEIENLINENPCLRFSLNALRQVLELQPLLLQQAEVQIRAVIAKMKFDMKI